MALERKEIAAQLKQARDLRSTRIELDGQRLTKIPEELFKLPDLETIDLSGNSLRTIPERLWDLAKLRSVNLIGNPIESLPDRPGLILDGTTYRRLHRQVDARNVTLDFDNNTPKEDLRFWAAELRATRGLHGLRLGLPCIIGQGHNHPKPSLAIQEILDSLAELDLLETLLIRGLHLGIVPEGIQQLRRLKTLDLSALHLQELPDWIGNLELETIIAMDNQLSTVPAWFRNLRRLRQLSLSFNPLRKIPQVVFDITSLEAMHVWKCGLREIPADILRLPRLQHFVCDKNWIESPPAEVVDKGLEAIRDYWRQRADAGVDYLCEAKLIILGEAGAGKTSLARKIENPRYELRREEKSTEGIDVIRCQFPTTLHMREDGNERALERNFQVNIWDFGGQEIYHATHQFFLTRRSVYILVCDDRKEDTDFSYWLQVIEMLSDASPLLIVQNEKQDRKRDINLSDLRARFANLRGAVATNLDTNRGLDRVIQTIRKELETLPHVGVGLPATWKRVREALEQEPRDYIGLEEYLGICQQHGFTRRDDKLQLSGYLHDLGICLHFQDDPLLNKTVVLKPSWGTDAVYRVLDDSDVIAARGHFSRQQLGRIWSEAKYEGMQEELLQLMVKFQLCYALEGGQTYIAPQLLSSEQPSYPWEPAGSLVVRYEYGFLPKGILTRLIVALHHLIAGGKLMWKTGVVLERDGTRAEILEEYFQRRIRVRVSGPDPYGLLAIVDDQLERLHAAFPRLQYEKFLPCPCAECRTKAEPGSFALGKLLKMAAKESQLIQCYESSEMVNAFRLIADVLPGALFPRFVSFEAPLASSAPPPIPEVFVSYAWSEESSALVDRLQQVLGEQGVRLLRDREEIRYKDSIRDFMRRLGQAKCVVVVISDKYLKSESCMFELTEVAKAQSLRERIFPIVLPDANLYKAIGLVGYVRHWEDASQELDTALKSVRGDNLPKLQENLTLYAEIRRLFDGIADTLRDMNALTPEQHEGSGFEELIRRIRAQLSA